VDRSADIGRAASDIVSSKAFDCSTICATEQAVVADAPIADALRQAMQAEGAHWLDAAERRAVEGVVFRRDGAIDPRAVGRTAQQLATLAGIVVPEDARVLVAELDGVGPMIPLSAEKLTTVLGWYTADGWRAGCERSVELLHHGGLGHTIALHATDEDVIMAWGMEKPAFRVLVNTWSTLGAIGATTGLSPSMTLAPGGIGGAVVSDNISVHHVLNVKRLAREIRRPPAEAFTRAPAAAAGVPAGAADRDLVEAVVRQVLSRLDATT
jgi:acetaldehyde dehydrogenase (acetylating)